MKFDTKLNDGIVTVEYEADQSDGQVWECEVWYQGKIVTQLVSGADYAVFLIDCEVHYRAHCAAEQFDYSMFLAECEAAYVGHPA